MASRDLAEPGYVALAFDLYGARDLELEYAPQSLERVLGHPQL